MLRSQRFFRHQMLKVTAGSQSPIDVLNEEQPIVSPVLASSPPESPTGVAITTRSPTGFTSKRFRTISGDLVASPVCSSPSNTWTSRERGLHASRKQHLQTQPPPPPTSPPPEDDPSDGTSHTPTRQPPARPSLTRQISRQQSVAAVDDDGVLVPEPACRFSEYYCSLNILLIGSHS